MNDDPLHAKPIEYGSLLTNLFGSAAFRALFTISFFVSVIVGPITYWAFDNQHPYDFIGDESYIIPSEAQGNDQMLVKWRVVFHRVCPGLIRRQLFDPHTNVILALYDPQPALTDPLPHKDGYLNKTFLLPRQIQSGWIGYRSSIEMWCNPLQRIWPMRYDTPALFFKVGDPPPP